MLFHRIPIWLRVTAFAVPDGGCITPQAHYEIWTQDAFHSAGYVNCASQGTLDAEALAGFDINRQMLLSIAAEAIGNGSTLYRQYLGLQEALLRCLPEEVRREASVEAARLILSQQPAVMRLRSSRQPLTLPPGLSGGAFTNSSSSTVAASADGFQYASQGGDGAAPKLQLRTGVAFDLSVQLYDVIDVPAVVGE